MSDPRKPLKFLSGQLRAYHGTPYAFDKFDASKIGSGEGAQAYGYGHYFAGNEDVARGYRSKLAPTIESSVPLSEIEDKLAKTAINFGGGLEGAVDLINKYRGKIPTITDEVADAVIGRIRSGDIRPGGHMYDVTLGVNPEHLLNWDAPLSGQSPSVHRLFDDQVGKWKKQGILQPSWAKDYDQGVLSGRELYNSLGDEAVSRRDIPPLASKNAVDLGIPGIRYLDGFSRNAGEGTHNYVMFPGTEDLININRRYEQGGPVEMSGGGPLRALNSFAKEMLGALRPSKVGPEFERADEMLRGAPAEALHQFTGFGPKAYQGTGGSRSFDPFALDKLDSIPEMEPLRDRLHDVFGNTMPLMRSQYPVPGFPPHRKYLSWSSDPAFVQDHAGMIPKPPPFYADDYIRKMEEDYARDGLAKISKSKELRREVQPPEWAHLPDYPQIYHNNEHITDADSVRAYMNSLNEDHRYYQDLNAERARKIQMERIPLEDILWGTDRANQSEFIVRNKAEGGPVNTPTEGEGGLYAAPNSTFDTPPPYEWGYRPGGAHADGGPVEMALGGTTPVSTGGQYQPRESEGPGFFRNQDNYANSSAGGINFVKKFVQSLSPAEQEAQRLVSNATRKTGKEAVIFGRGEDPADLTALTHGNYDNVKVPSYYQQFAGQSSDPFFSLHSHPTSTLAPSTADLMLWGNKYTGTLGLPYQSMLINASPQDSVLRFGVPGKFMSSEAKSVVDDVMNLKRENDELVYYKTFMHPRIQEFMKGNNLPTTGWQFHEKAKPMPGVVKYLEQADPDLPQNVTVRDLYAGNFLQRMAERGVPVDVSAEHGIAGTPYLAQDVWPEFAAHVKKHGLADGGPVEMEKGGALRKAAAAIKRLASDPAWDSAKANTAQYEIAGMGKGAGPLDLSDLDQRIPGILQEAIPRTEPPRGVSPRLQDALANPRVLSGIEDSIRHGQTLGADKWYHNNPLYQAFVKELGPEQGHADFMKYMDYQSAASPRSDVPTNIRNASYYFTNEGKDPRSWAEMPANPAPYGHIAQGLHRSNADVVRANEGDWGGYDVFKNPKPPSYGTNLGGNLLPVALDSHAFKNIGMRSEDPRFLMTSLSDFLKVDPFSDVKLAEADDIGGRLSFAQQYGTPGAMKDGKYRVDYKPQQLVTSGRLSMDEALSRPVLWDAKPRDNEYAAGEKMYQQMGFDMGMDPADAQSAAWAGAGKLTGLGTPPDKTFGQMHNERVLLTAKLRGEDPEETLRKLIRREAPLFAEGGTVEDEYHPIWQQSFAGGGQPEEPRGYYTLKEKYANKRRENAERLAQEDVEIKKDLGGHYRDMATQIPRGMASVLEIPGLIGDALNLRADYLDSVAPGSSPMRVPHWGTSEGISKGIDSLFPETTSRYGGETGRALGEMSLNALGLGIANNAGRVARSLGHVGNSANLAFILGGGPGGDMEPTEQQPPSEPSYAYEQFLRSQDPTYKAFEAKRPFYGMAQGGHAKDTGNTFDFLGPFGAGLNLIADGAGAVFNGEDFELDKALGYLGEIGGSLVAPGVGGALGRGAGTGLAHLIEPGEGDVGRDALNAGYGALRGGMGMFMAHGGSTGRPFGEEDTQDNLTPFLSPMVNPSVQPDPMDWAAANGVPGAIAPPLNRGNDQRARDAAERQRLMQMSEMASQKALQPSGGGGGGGGMGDIMGMAKMAMQIAPMFLAEGGSIPNQDGEQPWMYGDGALMARGGYLRGCGGMNG